AHWLPLANMGTGDFQMIVRTFISVFPHARLYWTGGRADTILLGRKTSWPPISQERWHEAAETLDSIYIQRPEEMDALLIADRKVLLEWVGEGPFNTIDRPLLEFSAPKSLFHDTSFGNYDILLGLRRRMAGGDPSAAWQAASFVIGWQTWAETRGRSVGNAVLWDGARCSLERPTCASTATSGLLRRALYLSAVREGDAAVESFSMVLTLEREWWFQAMAKPQMESVLNNLEHGLTAYEAAASLVSASHPDERAELLKRVETLLSIVPTKTPQAHRLGLLRGALRAKQQNNRIDGAPEVRQ
ncbi:MAG: hypothetical protein AAFX99_16945, partial [Myxococcota bacterium]